VSVPLPNSAIHVLTVARSSWSLPGIAGDVIIIMGRPGLPAATAETPALPAPKRNTRVEVAREFKVPERKLRSIVEIEKSDPIAIDRIARGETTIIQERAKLNAAARAAVAERTPTVPTGRYSCIVIDPPWPMEKIEREVRPALRRQTAAHHCGAGPRPGRRLPPVAGAHPREECRNLSDRSG